MIEELKITQPSREEIEKAMDIGTAQLSFEMPMPQPIESPAPDTTKAHEQLEKLLRDARDALTYGNQELTYLRYTNKRLRNRLDVWDQALNMVNGRKTESAHPSAWNRPERRTELLVIANEITEALAALKGVPK